MTNDPTTQFNDILTGAKALFKPKQLVEVRARTTSGYWRGFYFDDHDYMASIVLQLDGDPRVQALYYVLNEIQPTFVEQRQKCTCDKCVRGGLIIRNPTDEQISKILDGPTQHLTTNEDIRTIRFLFIDCDTVRAEKHEHDCSTAEEKAVTREVAKKVIEYLGTKDWPSALIADSGNGFHILPKIEQPNTISTGMYVVDCLKALAKKFDTPGVEIDNSVFNAARLTRAYGSTTRKGVETPDRPFRQNHLVPPKGFVGTVSLDQLIALADEAPQTSKTPRGDMPMLHDTFDSDDFFRWYEEQGAFEITTTKDWQGHTIAVTDRCIISGTKHTGSSLTGFVVGDSFGYHCWSPECDNPQIGDVLRKLHEEGYKRYPKKIWVEEPLMLNFEKNMEEFETVLQEETEQYKPPAQRQEPALEEVLESQEDTEIPEETENYPPSITDKLEERIMRDETEDLTIKATDIGNEPPPTPTRAAKEKPVRIGDIIPNQYAEWLMGVVFRDPKKAGSDFGFYKKRLERVSQHLTETVREAFGAMLFFERANKYLPSKAELADYINNSEDCLGLPDKPMVVSFVHAIKDDGTHFFDTTAKRLISEMDWCLENDIVRKAFKDQLRGKRDIDGFRTALRKHWATSIGFNSDYRPGTWQENADAILEAFRRDLTGEGDARKFRLGFESIDNSGMNIGLDGNHALAIYGPASNRKTNFVMSMALNFAMDGKRGLLLVGEHLREKIEKRLTLMLSYYLRKDEKNPEGLVPVIPGLSAWESRNVTATQEDLANVGLVLAELKAMRIVPGYLEVQNINSLTRGEDDPVGAIMNYIDATHKKYDWDFVIIDPLDTILPVDMGDKNQQMSGAFAVIDRLFDYSRSFAGDRGLMLVVTAQFKADVRREIEKVQAKNGGADDFDDEIVSILRRDSGIQYIGNKLTQRFDLAIGVALRVKDGSDGMLVKGRSREANGLFDVVYVTIDEQSNLMIESAGSVTRKVAQSNGDAPPSMDTDYSPYDTL